MNMSQHTMAMQIIKYHNHTMHSVDTIMPEMMKLRVHIAPLGFEIDRIVIPATDMKADKIYLLRHSNHSEDMSGLYREKIIKKLKRKNIEVKEIDVNRNRLLEITKAVKDIIMNERKNDIYLNVGTGSKIHAVGCMMASMIFDDRTNIHPYYAEPKSYHSYKGSEQQTVGVKEIHKLPTYQIRTPPTKLLAALEIIRKAHRITKKDLAEIADANRLIIVGARQQNMDQARYASLDKNIIQPLEKDWNFIKVEKLGRNRYITLTEDGEHASEFLA